MTKLNIVFITDGLPFNGDTIKQKALGGSESAMIYVAREFARIGHIVQVYCNCDAPCVYDGVRYIHNSGIDKFVRFGECDVLIVSRHFNFLSNKYNSKMNILWTHDVPHATDQLAQVMWNIDKIWCLSEYHAQLYREALPDVSSIISVQRNGIDPDLIPEQTGKKHRIMFTSRPERGIIKAFDYYEKLGDKSLEFLFCSYDSIDVPEVRYYDNIADERARDLLAKGFNVAKGRFNKEDLYKLIAESKAIIYPTRFPEISCISAIEAQACGTPFITTNDFALTETMAYKGIDDGERYDSDFFDCLKAAVNGSYVQEIKNGIVHSNRYHWNNVVTDMLQDIVESFFARSSDYIGIIERLYYESDLIGAAKYADAMMLTDWQEKLALDLRFVHGEADYKGIYEDPDTFESVGMDMSEAYNNPRYGWFAGAIQKHGIKSCLDYACHLGSNSFFAKIHSPDCEFYGYDISELAIERAKKRLSTQFADMTGMTFSNDLPDGKKFDAVLLGEVLEHIEDFAAFLHDVETKYLNPGGKIFITLPRGAWEHMSRIKNKPNYVQYHVHHFELMDVLHCFGGKPNFYYETTHFTEGYCGEPLGHYLIEYTSDGAKVKDRDYGRKWELVRPYQSISCCMICRDAEQTIEKTLSMVYEHVDHIVIALDHEQGENEELERRIFDFDKNCKIEVRWMPERIVSDLFGFANARNFSMMGVKSKWIFWIDSDEEFYCYDKIRRYLDNTHINGYTIAQHHPEIDGHIGPDFPARLFRNGVAEFQGWIHEQAMMVGDINQPVEPALKLASADIVNLGEMTEHMRRGKALKRNMLLLKKDTIENVDKRRHAGLPIRKLTIILIIRDLVNRIKWGADSMGTYQTRDAIEVCLPKIMSLYTQFFADETDDLYYLEARKHVNEALVLTGAGEVVDINIGGTNTNKTVVLKSNIYKLKQYIRDLI